MRAAVAAPSLVVFLAACSPTSFSAASTTTYRELHGDTDVTIADTAKGGDGTARAGHLDARACWWRDEKDGSMLTLRLGSHCTITTAWTPRATATIMPTGFGVHASVTMLWHPAGGAGGTYDDAQPCGIVLGDTWTPMYVQRATVLQTAAGGPVDVTLGGVTVGTPQRYVTLHFAGSPGAEREDAWCGGGQGT